MIDVAVLREAGACPEALAWMARQDASVSGDHLIDQMLAEQRLDFYVWGFLKLPRVRRSGRPERMASVFGPNHAALGTLADRVAQAAWLERARDNDGALVDQRVRSHLRRLSKFGFASPAVLRVERVSMTDAYASTIAVAAATRAHDGLQPADQAHAWSARFWRSRGRLVPRLSETALRWLRTRARIEAELARRLRDLGARATDPMIKVLDDMVVHRAYTIAHAGFVSAARTPSWASAEAGTTVPAVADAAQWLVASARADVVCHALHLLADVQAASPYAPLIDLWFLGYWPAGIAGGVFHVGDPGMGWSA